MSDHIGKLQESNESLKEEVRRAKEAQAESQSEMETGQRQVEDLEKLLMKFRSVDKQQIERIEGLRGEISNLKQQMTIQEKENGDKLCLMRSDRLNLANENRELSELLQENDQKLQE